MGRTSALSSDLDFIKEFEELKIKQKLLVETLNKKKHAFENKFLIDMNSKLDFLVKIFQQATVAEQGNHDENKVILDQITALNEKLTELESKFEERFESLNTILSNNDSIKSESSEELKLTEADNSNISSSIATSDNPVAPVLAEEGEAVDKNKVTEEQSSPIADSIPPIPDFKAQPDSNDVIESKVTEVQNADSGEKKKRKWF